MPTTYTPEQVRELTKQFEEYDAEDFGDDAGFLKSRLGVSMEKGQTAAEMISEAQTTVGRHNPDFAIKFAQVVRRLSIP